MNVVPAPRRRVIILVTLRSSRQCDVTKSIEPIGFGIRTDLAPEFANNVGQSSVLLERGIDLDVAEVAQPTAGVRQHLDDDKALIVRLKDRAELRLTLTQCRLGALASVDIDVHSHPLLDGPSHIEDGRDPDVGPPPSTIGGPKAVFGVDEPARHDRLLPL